MSPDTTPTKGDVVSPTASPGPPLPASLQPAASITTHLASRFYASSPATRISSHALAILNTYQSTAKDVDGEKESATIPEATHVVDGALARLSRLSENQTFLFLGESGSGKSWVRSHVIAGLLRKSGNTRSTMLSLTTCIFDSLTTLQTVASSKTSKAGLLYQLQYDTSTPDSILIGGAILGHRLPRSQFSHAHTDGRSYRILYYLISGASDAERAHFGFKNRQGSTHRWKYLGPSAHFRKNSTDVEGFHRFKSALWELDFQQSEVAQICEIFAAVLHIGQLEFHRPAILDVEGLDGGVAELAQVQNTEVLDLISSFLGAHPAHIEALMVSRTERVHGETITIALDPSRARANAAMLASMLYDLTTGYIIERMNQQTLAPDGSVVNTISLVDFPGLSHQPSTGSTLDQLLNNSSAEFMYNLSLHAVKRREDLLQAEEIPTVGTAYFDNSNTIKGLFNPQTGLLRVVEEQHRNNCTDSQLLTSVRSHFEGKSDTIHVRSSVDGLPLKGFLHQNLAVSFTVKHFAGEVEYSVKELMKEDSEANSRRFYDILKSSKNEVVASLFREENDPGFAYAQQSTTPRASSATFKFDDFSHPDDAGRVQPYRSSSAKFLSPLRLASKLVKSPNTNLYLMFSLNSNDGRVPRHFNTPCVRAQVQALGIPEIVERSRTADFNVTLPFGQFIALANMDAGHAGSEREAVLFIIVEKGWPENEALVGSTSVLLSERCWMEMEDLSDGACKPRRIVFDWELNHRMTLSEVVNSSSERLLSTYSAAYRDENPVAQLDTHDLTPSAEIGSSTSDPDHTVSTINERDVRTGQRKKTHKNRHMDAQRPNNDDPGRQRWLFLVYVLTFFMPDFCIRHLGGMASKDVRMAWREKLAINIIIWLSCGATVFFVMVVPLLICPKQHVFNAKELSSHNGKKHKSEYVAIRGEVFNLGAFIPRHYPSYIAPKLFTQFAGTDITALFPVQVSALCAGVNGSVSDSVTLDKPYNASESSAWIDAREVYAQYHDFRAFTNDSRPDWFFEQMMMLRARYRKGAVGYSRKSIRKMVKKNHKVITTLNGRVYDLTEYLSGGLHQYSKAGKAAHFDPNAVNFMHQSVLDLFQQKSGDDITKSWKALTLDNDLKSRMKVCLDNLFYIGDLDHRNSTKCQFANWLPLVVSILLCSVIAVKFASSISLSAKNAPEKVEKFVICQIPAYTEDEDSLRRAIDSVARMQYDDKRKLLIVVCDGLVVGEGNDKSTPRIVLDILGVPDDPSCYPEPLSFESIGHGSQRHNMGHVYSGLYEVYGHLVPFLVIVKVGKPSEATRPRPGNRGKRDSQMILMRFLNRVHYGLAMSPLELEIFHHIRNIIGVNPAFYEFILQIDADTIVAQDAATRMVSAFIDDMRLIAVCGETGLSNAKATAVTMIQVYEYFISHNLSKAFESLFGCVTCLPGCFSMYRIFASGTGKPLFVSHKIVESYATMDVDTLHMKNLLSLGEDRYLTTLLLKHHGKYQMKFLPSAQAWTVAPETWQVFLSQRRRWINSTVHNLVELLSISQICGFLFFSMHFVVIIDLITTVVQPVAIAYIIYLIIQIVKKPSVLPLMAIIILAIVYGIQVVAFLLRRKWDMAGWMLIYLAALPVFSFCLPLYSFWYMDDFDWGNTRIVAGEKGKRVEVDEDDVDVVEIPRMRWDEYQFELYRYEAQETNSKRDSSFSNLDQVGRLAASR
ncbi:class V chitin synthase [Thelonectria olida]|uniref:chitin synthase n=1 Tax=Thelonectria olida TaxID=1576542 RepID=A0A9P8VW09_9HYPO|nr:class V chitin synthase [Thelonectria olida]